MSSNSGLKGGDVDGKKKTAVEPGQDYSEDYYGEPLEYSDYNSEKEPLLYCIPGESFWNNKEAADYDGVYDDYQLGIISEGLAYFGEKLAPVIGELAADYGVPLLKKLGKSGWNAVSGWFAKPETKKEIKGDYRIIEKGTEHPAECPKYEDSDSQEAVFENISKHGKKGDRFLSINMFREVLEKTEELQHLARKVLKRIEKADKDKNGKIHFKEFQTFYKPEQ